MQLIPALRQLARLNSLALPLLVYGAAGFAADVYNPANHQLTVNTLQIGSATWSDLVVTVGSIVTPPHGGSAPINDTFTPTTQELAIGQVYVGLNYYFNPVVTIGEIISIGGIAGAAMYDGTNLTVPVVQMIGGGMYTNVIVKVGHVVSVAGVMPLISQNAYDPTTRLLTMPVVGFGGHFYTNVAVTVGPVQSVGGVQRADSVLWSFSGNGGVAGSTDAAVPDANMILGSDGNFYGTTNDGGTYNQGTVFKVTSTGVESVQHSFSGNGGLSGSVDGANPNSPLVEGTDGKYYGTTWYGGANNTGSVYNITSGGLLTTIFSYALGYTSSPNALALGNDGNFYGTDNLNGDVNGFGTIFRITPAGVEATLYTFGASGFTDGQYPYAGLTLGTDGNFYGTTSGGGENQMGTVFKVTPEGAESVIYSFRGPNPNEPILTDPTAPSATLLLGTDGNFYGTAVFGGTYGAGAVFKITPAGTETVLYSFTGEGAVPGSSDGANPTSGLILGSDGNFYGTTNYGGAYNRGAVFKVTPAGAETVVYSFSGAGGLTGSPDGAAPNGVTQGNDGALYGATSYGGMYNQGAIFKLATGNPPP